LVWRVREENQMAEAIGAGASDADPQRAASAWGRLVRIAGERLPQRHEDDVQELADEAFVLLEGAEIESSARCRDAVEEARRRLRRVARPLRPRVDGARMAPHGRAIPRLCPRLAELAETAGDRLGYLATLRDAAVRAAHEPGVLRDVQLRLFLLAYADGLSPAALSAHLSAGERATVERLRRASRTVERELLRALARIIDAPPSRLVVRSGAVEDASARAEMTSRVWDGLRVLAGPEV
jgi:hypothetical protein